MTDAGYSSSPASPGAGAQARGSATVPAPSSAVAPPGQSTESANRFSMAVPSGWMILPMDPATRDRRIAGLVKHRIGKEDRHAYLRRQYVLKLRKLVAQAADNGTFFGAVHSGVLKGMPMMASVLVSMLPRLSDAAGNVLTDPAALAADVAAGRDEASKGETLEQGVAELQVGVAARIRRRAPIGIQSEDGREVIGETIHYYVPLPEAKRTLGMVFSTPLLSVAEAYAELFDVMALSANWKRTTQAAQAPGEQAGSEAGEARPRRARAVAEDVEAELGETGAQEEVRPRHARRLPEDADAEPAADEEVRPRHARTVPEEASR